jgi:hypothetical protein
MGAGVLGWRVLPYARTACLVSWDPCGPRDKYVTACGRVNFCRYVDDKPQAKRCKKCERAAAPQSGAP